MRAAELLGADRLSETEVVSIVRDLDENVYQVVVSLVEACQGEIEVIPAVQLTHKGLRGFGLFGRISVHGQ